MNEKQILGGCLLASVKIETFGNSRKDKRVTEETLDSHGASRDAGAFNKTLLPPESLRPIRDVASEWRTYHRTATLPWGDEKGRLITLKAFDDYSRESRARKENYEARVAVFVVEYPALLAAAPARLNGLFEKKYYPTAEEIGGHFSAAFRFSPIAAAGDFRVEIQEDQLDALKASHAENLERCVKEAQREALERLAAPLRNVVKILTTPGIKPGSIQVSLAANVRDAVALMPSLTFEPNAELERLCEEAEKLAPEDLGAWKESALARRDTAQAAQDILSRLSKVYA